jgi:peptidoglycan/xylan/chitin deacetylase (PgdA/CDA1 family)
MAVGVEGGTRLGLKTYPQTLPLGDREVVLTFDDGPLPGPTDRVLEALARECTRATFFLIGRNAARSPGLVRREIAEGHTVGHHSLSHPGVTLRGLGEAAGEREILAGMAAVDQAGWGGLLPDGSPHVPFFRFPGFADTPALLQFLASRNIAVFGTDFWASDWLPMSPQEELGLVLARLEQAGRGIVLFHDTQAHTAAMLPAFLRALRERGYRVVHIMPAPGPAVTRAAGPGWRSETEPIVQHVLGGRRAKSRAAGEPDPNLPMVRR